MRTVGIKTFLLLFLIILVKKNKKIIIEVPTSFSTLSKEFHLIKNKNFMNFFYYYSNYLLTPFMLIFFKKIIYYDQEKIPFSIFIKKYIPLS